MDWKAKYESLQNTLKRERLARKKAEQIIEMKSLELYELNQELVEANTNLEKKVRERTNELESTLGKMRILNQQLMTAKDNAEKAMRAKTDFLSAMSHEIRTPLNGVVGIVNLLIQSEPLERQMRNLRTLKFSSENLMAIINDILDYNRIEAGKLDLEEVDFDLAEVVDNLMNTWLTKANEKGVNMELQVDDNELEILKGDSTRLVQVLNNLIGNAIKFTEKGTVTLGIEKVKDLENILVYHFRVKDTGIGIPENKLGKIFDSFSQADSSTSRKYGGSGLGLAICMHILKAQGSQIYVESIEGEGSTFYFTIRFKKSNKTVEELKNNESIDFKGLDGTEVLLVEDNPFNTDIATQFLQVWGCNVSHAENGIQAVERIQERPYDIVLMDLQMPEMDGYEATQRIRGLDGKYKEIPVLALTASALLEVRKKVYEYGMNGYITKPFDPSNLFYTIYEKIVEGKSL
ncbi:response regulator [Sediminitomix flava]|uniref:histidine kinase n=1 Tax=Sediminitomix flava TaxID=379075 RepID=A0A315ZAE0_SEDFL|nr:response regulator [Sediminitomix flava]PWJ42555.1 signal transduction histidine kinase [Sediminitomix flava]